MKTTLKGKERRVKAWAVINSKGILEVAEPTKKAALLHVSYDCGCVFKDQIIPIVITYTTPKEIPSV